MRTLIVAVAAGMLLLGCGEKIPCGTCAGSGARSCGAPGCDRGRAPCTGSCIKRENPDWQTRNVSGVPNNIPLLEFRNANGTAQYVSQNHVGQTVEFKNGEWVLGGPCALCQGSTRIVCPSCRGKNDCPACGGKGQVRK